MSVSGRLRAGMGSRRAAGEECVEGQTYGCGRMLTGPDQVWRGNAVWPGPAALVLTLIVGIWAFVGGCFEIFAGFGSCSACSA